MRFLDWNTTRIIEKGMKCCALRLIILFQPPQKMHAAQENVAHHLELRKRTSEILNYRAFVLHS